MASTTKMQPDKVRTIEITEPGTAQLISEEIPPHDQPGTALIRSTYSAVSPGTELLVFNGDMPEDESNTTSLDSTISELNDVNSTKTGLYPCKYGYSSVGTIIHLTPPLPLDEVNGDAQDPKTLFQVGDRVFAFREHTSHFVQRVTNLQRVPYGVHDRDAVMLPTVETAISILFDAAPFPGEEVSIVGQGLVGLVLTAVTRLLHPFCKVITHDMSEARRTLSKNAADAHLVLDPHLSVEEKLDEIAHLDNEEVEAEGETGADVSIEVSGSGAGLNVAIDTTRNDGTLVLASWYGNKPVVVPALGSTRFHRSHVKLVASQVSRIPSDLRGRWSKRRRFQLAWRVIEAMRPAEKFDIAVFSPREAQSVYEQLQRKEIVGALFQWSGSSSC